MTCHWKLPLSLNIDFSYPGLDHVESPFSEVEAMRVYARTFWSLMTYDWRNGRKKSIPSALDVMLGRAFILAFNYNHCG
jgi:hypothetical protein